MNKNNKIPKLVLKDGSYFEGVSFGADKSISGEVVFATGMVGYPEALTDPSFRGQILVLTYPLIGNYGVPKNISWESKKIQVAGLVVSSYIDTPSHFDSEMSLGSWLNREGIPALEIKDTRAITHKLRESGSMLGNIINPKGKKLTSFADPNHRNLVAEVSTKEILFFGRDKKETVVLIDCGAKENIIRQLMARNLRVAVVPWDTDILNLNFPFSGVVISNGPGDPKKVTQTISNVKKLLHQKIPIFGICLGNQILTLAGGGNTYKLKFGHRSQNQPAVSTLNNRGFLTTQNHGFEVRKIPKGFKEWFYNGNDRTNEGIIHESLPFMSVQFHPESSPGPLDTDWLFDYFLEKIKEYEQRK